ncbi:MAG: DUF1553 domain-containing protein [Planctomycetota bacterium]
MNRLCTTNWPVASDDFQLSFTSSNAKEISRCEVTPGLRQRSLRNPRSLFQWLLLCGWAVAVLGGGPGRLWADEKAVDFARDVVPLLQQHCVRCHHSENRKGEISLSTISDLRDNGHVVAGKPDESDLLTLVTSQGGKPPQMPKDGAPLSPQQVSVLRRWIALGAAWPESIVIHELARAGKDWWSLQPVAKVAVPSIPLAAARVGNADWSLNPIDRFVLAQLLEKDLQPSSAADRRTLIRRVSFDLLGLPPTPDEVEAFVNDPNPRAYEKLVDDMLASPHYGERWTRHWLDIAHYADTHGFERDQRRDNAWRYRDWVVRALNNDMPYNAFLTDQMAGDVLRPDDPDAVLATGFLAAGPWDFVGQVETRSDVLRRAARADDLDDMVTQVITAACGVTINCARCHDHKLDPIPQRDYYSLWAVFAGVKRGERDVSAKEVRELEARKQTLRAEIQQVAAELAKRRGPRIDLADIVGGGDGHMTGKPGEGIDPLTGKPQSALRGVLQNVQPNHFVRSTVRFVDGVVVPNASPEGTPISSTGLRIQNVPKTSAQVWDAVRFGPVNSQFSTKLDDVDFNADGHTLLSLHANAAITFDLEQLRQAGAPAEMKFTASAGYFGETPNSGASFAVYVDGESRAQRERIGRTDGVIAVDVAIPSTARFLTLWATDGGNGIGHDQICFTDPSLSAAAPAVVDSANQAEIERLQLRRTELEQQLKAVPAPSKVYGILSETPAPVKLLKRGDPEQPEAEVAPAALSSVVGLSPELATSQTPEGERRRALASWVTSPVNPLTRRVVVNRLWHYHFGVGLVDTPSDLGYGGGKPSHPELLDWLATELLHQKWSLKSLHRLICTSQAYRQQSTVQPGPATEQALKLDAGNRLLWRMNPRRLDAESVRDAVLTVSGKLNPQMFGPGYRDFDYQEEYAPIYRYITPDSPDLWRRSVYRFIVRTTTHQFLTTLDCPNAANLTPARNVTTTALQSLALLNNDFMLRQSGYFAARLQTDAGDAPAKQVERAFFLTFGRTPSPEESQAAIALVQSRGLPQFCRMLLNANEFVYVD